MKKRNFITLILGATVIALGFLYPILYFAISLNPTKTYWQALISMLPCSLFFIGTLIILFAVFGFIFPKFVERNCPVSTTLSAVGISFCGAVGFLSGLYLMIPSPWYASTPIADQAFALTGSLTFLGAWALLFLYVYFRGKKPSFVGVIIDLLIVALLFVPFLFTFEMVYEISSYIFHTFIE